MKKKPDVEHEAVRGIVTGEEEIPIDEIGVSLREALVPTNGILRGITRAVEGPGLSLNPKPKT